LSLKELRLRPVKRCEEQHDQFLMQRHHYLGALPKIGETLWYVATWHEQWVALVSFSAAALKCAARDQWIGWDFRHQYDRLNLLSNNSRFLILPNLLRDIALYFEQRQEPDFVVGPSLEHGRVETRKIWTTSALNDYLDFPHVGQAFVIERERIDKKTGKHSDELAYGITSRPPEQADAQQVLTTNRDHWGIENRCHYVIDCNFDEDRSRIRTGYGPENVSRLRRFAVGIIKSKGVSNVAQKMRQLHRSTRLVFDYLRMSENTCAAATG